MVTVRRAAPADLALVTGITKAAYEPYIATLGAPPPPMRADYAEPIAEGQVWLFSNGGAEAGVAVIKMAADHLTIVSLAVLPAAQGLGLGRHMLDFAVGQAREAGLPEVRLYTNPKMERNVRVYTQAGFVETGHRPNPLQAGWVLMDMTLQVPPVQT